MRNVLVHIDEREKWPMVISNVHNMLNYYAKTNESCHIEIVANGQAVLDYKTDAVKDKEALALLAKEHVILMACNNALTGLNVKADELLDFITVIPAGVVELVEKQYEGYAYLKP